MGLTYAKAIAANKLGQLDEILIFDTDELKKEELKADGRFTVLNELADGVKSSDYIMIAVKPQIKEVVFEQIKKHLDDKKVIISIMAGVSIDTIQNGLGVHKVVRVMPNLPAQLGLGMTTYFPDKSVNSEEMNLVATMLKSTGELILLTKEDDINTSTAISGSGPGYVFYFMQGMLDAAKHFGYDDETAKLLVAQTFEGAVQQFKKGDATPVEWMDRVASKGGTTREALNTFDNYHVREGIKAGAIACYDRAIELSKG